MGAGRGRGGGQDPHIDFENIKFTEIERKAGEKTKSEGKIKAAENIHTHYIKLVILNKLYSPIRNATCVISSFKLYYLFK